MSSFAFLFIVFLTSHRKVQGYGHDSNPSRVRFAYFRLQKHGFRDRPFLPPSRSTKPEFVDSSKDCPGTLRRVSDENDCVIL